MKKEEIEKKIKELSEAGKLRPNYDDLGYSASAQFAADVDGIRYYEIIHFSGEVDYEAFPVEE